MNKPNVILINCDDMGYGDLGCYGSKINDTPAIDRLAEKGMRFTDFYAASPLCSPSRGALMTGCYPPRISFGSFEGYAVLFPGQGVGLNKNEYTIANLFKNNGYSTKIVGKWHCGDQKEFLPTNFGFDEYFGLPYSNDMGMQANTQNRKVKKLKNIKIDGKDMSPLFTNDNTNVENVFFYYLREQLEAVRKGDWKLHFSKDGEKVNLLYNLKDDVSEQNNLYKDRPDMVKELSILADEKRKQIGDSVLEISGEEVREIGRVQNPKPLTSYDQNHPYIVLMYDKEDRG